MTDREKRDRAADIGDEALDIEAGPGRDRYIDEHCAGDSELAQYVRQYLGVGDQWKTE